MTESSAGGPPAAYSGAPMRVSRVLPLYLIVFVGFVRYSLMIAIFTPLVLAPTAGSCFVAGLAEANIAVAPSAIADIAPTRQRSRLFRLRISEFQRRSCHQRAGRRKARRSASSLVV